ncbi:MAG TPA: hypothetical protein DCM02_03165 [Flavobacterium sp.]|nr:hypothetical protein [Flavobacterium sp.]
MINFITHKSNFITFIFTKANLNTNHKLTEKKPTINTSDWRGAGIAERRAGTTELSNLFGLFLLAESASFGLPINLCFKEECKLFKETKPL